MRCTYLFLLIFRDRRGQICGGSSHGACFESKCVCSPLYIGEDCSCSTSTQSCTPPGHQDVCSGIGQCVCNECVCPKANAGFYCEVSLNSTINQLCDTYDSCVLSTVLKNQTSHECHKDDGTSYNPIFVEYPIAGKFYNVSNKVELRPYSCQ